MNTTTLPHHTRSKFRSTVPAAQTPSEFVTPHFETQSQSDNLRVTVWVPDVQASGVEISTRGNHLNVTARKVHHVRANWKAMHLETAQRDYLLTLRLGRSLDFTRLSASLQDGILNIDIPLLQIAPSPHHARGDQLSAA